MIGAKNPTQNPIIDLREFRTIAANVLTVLGGFLRKYFSARGSFVLGFERDYESVRSDCGKEMFNLCSSPLSPPVTYYNGKEYIAQIVSVAF